MWTRFTERELLEGNMRIDKIHIKGFRNFDDIEISFQKKTLIIGANDVGKSNLLFALRLLFDKSISESDLELTDSDYNAYTNADTIEITVTICDVVEECLKSAFDGALKDGKIIIQYKNSKQTSYSMYWGYSEDTLSEIQTRQYIKRLNMQYLDANRNLTSFMNRERTKMLQISKDKRTEDDIDFDNSLINQIQTDLDGINNKVSSLKYVSSSLESVNAELSELSIHNDGQEVKYVSGNSKADGLLNNLVLSYSTESGPLSIGGDGRNNQIFIATWIAKQKSESNIDHVTFYAIEEPEAHLHPHQQRKLSEYIQNHLTEQIFITTHSPQIITRFNPSNIIRLFQKNKYTLAACGGEKAYITKVFNDFGYRLNTISAETFFADGVFLVEGVSEVLFYTALSKTIGIDLDRLNISILSVEGVGFKPYIAVCDSLQIPWVLRTDNDIFSKPTNKPTTGFYAGLSRAKGIIIDLNLDAPDTVAYWEKYSYLNEWPLDAGQSKDNITFHDIFREKLKSLRIYLSDMDLETDIANTALQPILCDYYSNTDVNRVIEAMKKKKAENMLGFLKQNEGELSVLISDKIVEPLTTLSSLVVERMKQDV